MDPTVQREINRRLRALEGRAVLVKGEITDDVPLSVALAGSDVSITPVLALSTAVAPVGAQVWCLKWPGDLLILGALEDDASAAAARATLGIDIAFSAYRSSAVSPSSTNIVVFNSEALDSHGFYSTSDGKFLPTVAGWYRFNWSLFTNTDITATYFQASLKKNGALSKVGLFQSNPTTGDDITRGHSAGTALLALNGSTDYAQIEVSFDQAGTVALEPSAPYTFFDGQFVRGL